MVYGMRHGATGGRRPPLSRRAAPRPARRAPPSPRRCCRPRPSSRLLLLLTVGSYQVLYVFSHLSLLTNINDYKKKYGTWNRFSVYLIFSLFFYDRYHWWGPAVAKCKFKIIPLQLKATYCNLQVK